MEKDIRNRNRCNLTYEHGRQKFSLICSSCFSILGNFEFSIGYHVNVKSDTSSELDVKSLAHLFEPRHFVFDPVPYKCPHCQKVTMCIIVDKYFSKIISKLNKAGIKTDYCCEGHVSDQIEMCEFAYLSFDAYYRQYFDIRHPLLRWWYLDESVSMNGELARIYLRIKEDCPLRYYKEKRHCIELEEYICEILIPLLNKERCIDETMKIDLKDMG